MWIGRSFSLKCSALYSSFSFFNAVMQMWKYGQLQSQRTDRNIVYTFLENHFIVAINTVEIDDSFTENGSLNFQLKMNLTFENRQTLMAITHK